MTDPAQLTVAKPPILDKLAAAIAGAVTAILAVLALLGWIPVVNIPPEAIVGAITAIGTVVATLRALRESKSSAATAALVTDLVSQLGALREQVAASAAVTTPVGEAVPRVAGPLVPTPAILGTVVKRQGGHALVEALALLAVSALLALGLPFGCDGGSSVGPGLVDVLSRVDARTVVRCSELEPGGGAVAGCLGAAVMTPVLQVLLERASAAVQRASMVGPGGAGADDATDEDRQHAAADLDKALDELSAAVADTHKVGKVQ